MWLEVNKCNGSHCAVVWNRWQSPCSGSLALVSMWEVCDTNRASSSQKTGTDGAGKWGTSQTHWNLLQRPSPHFSISPTFCFFPLLLSLPAFNNPVLQRLPKSTCCCKCFFLVLINLSQKEMCKALTACFHIKALWVIWRYRYLFTRTKMADGKVGLWYLLGKSRNPLKMKHVSSLVPSCTPVIHCS